MNPWKRKEIIGDCTLYLGDCREILPTLEQVDVVLTDPPYGISLKNHGGGIRSKRKKRSYSIIGDQSTELGQSILDALRGSARSIVAFADPTLPWQGQWRSLLVWDKGGAVGGGGDVKTTWKQTWELVQVWNERSLHGSRDNAVLRYWMQPGWSDIHPAIKPVELLCYLADKVSIVGSVILDPFMGSGTTGVACIRGGRRFIGVEIDEGYFDIACERIRKAYQQPDMFVTMPEQKAVQEAMDL